MPSFIATPANFTNNSDANFRVWGSYLSARLLASGLVKTGDTGQIDWLAVSAPTIANTFMGYEIWRFNDTLQATAPVFIKIEFGEAANIDCPGVRCQFGSGSNGVGGLTGTLSVQYVSGLGTPAVTAACIVAGSGDTNRFCYAGGFVASMGSIALYFGFERSKNAAGADTSEAVLGLFNNTSPSTTGTRFNPVWSTTLGDIGLTTVHATPALFPPGTTGASGAQVIVAPILHSKGIFMNPGMNFLGAYLINIPANSTPSIFMYGVVRTYYALSDASSITGAGWQGPGGGAETLCLRYD